MPSSRTADATRQALCNSLKKKMAVKPLDKITVREIAEDCGMSRQTFYYHFEDIYDQLKWMLNQEVFYLLRARASMSLWQDGLLQLLHYLEQNRAVYLCAIKSMGHEHLKQFFYDDVYGICKMIVDSFREEFEITDDYADFLNHYLTLSFSGLAESWILGEINRTPEEILQLIQTIVDDQLYGMRARSKKKPKNHNA